MQVPAIKISSENKKILLVCENDVSLGELHDFLLLHKGNTVERMIAIQRVEEEAKQKQTDLENEQIEIVQE